MESRSSSSRPAFPEPLGYLIDDVLILDGPFDIARAFADGKTPTGVPPKVEARYLLPEVAAIRGLSTLAAQVAELRKTAKSSPLEETNEQFLSRIVAENRSYEEALSRLLDTQLALTRQLETLLSHPAVRGALDNEVPQTPLQLVNRISAVLDARLNGQGASADLEHALSLRELRESGVLQEANRCFFHPLGLSLVVEEDIETGQYIRLLVGDYRASGGVFFGFHAMDDVQRLPYLRRQANVEQMRRAMAPARRTSSSLRSSNGVEILRPVGKLPEDDFKVRADAEGFVSADDAEHDYTYVADALGLTTEDAGGLESGRQSVPSSEVKEEKGLGASDGLTIEVQHRDATEKRAATEGTNSAISPAPTPAPREWWAAVYADDSAHLHGCEDDAQRRVRESKTVGYHPKIVHVREVRPLTAAQVEALALEIARAHWRDPKIGVAAPLNYAAARAALRFLNTPYEEDKTNA